MALTICPPAAITIGTSSSASNSNTHSPATFHRSKISHSPATFHRKRFRERYLVEEETLNVLDCRWKYKLRRWTYDKDASVLRICGKNILENEHINVDARLTFTQRPDMINPGVDVHGNPIDPRKMQQHFEDFYEDLFEELNKYGEIESLNVCDNISDHMFREEKQARNAFQNLQGRFCPGV